MSGTNETDSQLLAEAADGQGQGSYTLQKIRNIIASETGHITTALTTALPSASVSQLYGGSGSAGAATSVTLGTGLALASGTLSASAGNLELYNWNPTLQLINYRAARAVVRSGVAGSRCRIVCLGDSRTAGVTTGSSTNYRPVTSYPSRLITHLQSFGLSVQGDSWFGSGNDPNCDGRLALVGSTSISNWSGASAFGGPVLQISGVGGGINFTLPTAKTYDRVDISYIDNGGSVTVAVDGGSAITTITPGSTNVMAYQTVTLPNSSHSVLNIRGTNTSSFYLEGCAFWNSTVPAIEVYNGGIGGATSDGIAGGLPMGTYGYGSGQGAITLAPKLMIIDIGVNDINNGSDTAAQTVTNIMLVVTACRNINCDVVVVVPAPFSSTAYAAGLPALRAALQTSATTNNYGLVDWSHRYGDSYTVANANGIMASSLHMAPPGYDDIAARFAELLANA